MNTNIDKNVLLLEMVEDFLQMDYHLYIQFSKHYKKFINCFAKEYYTGIKYSHRPIDLEETLNEYVYISKYLREHEKMECVVSFNRDEKNFQVSIFEEQIKGLRGQDEYLEKVEQYSVCEDSLSCAFSRLDGHIGDEFEINSDKSQVRKRTLKKNSD